VSVHVLKHLKLELYNVHEMLQNNLEGAMGVSDDETKLTMS
jgi:hypothetical protein